MTTDQNGHYSLAGLPQGQYRLSVAAKGYRPKVANDGKVFTVDGKRNTSLSDVDSDLEKGGAIVDGIVKDATGGSVAGAVVRANFEDQTLPDDEFVVQTTLSDENGIFSLSCPPGMVGLVAIAEGYAPVQVFRTAPVSGVELIVTPASRIEGTVVTANEGRPVANIVVRAESQLGMYQEATSDNAGRFVIDGLRPGTYQLRAIGSGWLGDSQETVTLDIADVVDNVIIPVHSSVTISGTLLVDDGTRPCKSGLISLGPPAMNYSVPTLNANTDPDGTVIFQAVPPGTYEVVITCGGYGREIAPELIVGDQDISDLVWKITSHLRIEGQFVDKQGNSVKNLGFQLVPERAPDKNLYRPPINQHSLVTDETGHFAIGGMPAGNYTIYAFRMDEPVKFELSENNSPINLTLVVNLVGNIEVYVKNPQDAPVEGLSVSVETVDGTLGGGSASDFSHGTYAIGPIGVGSYYVYAGDGMNPRVQAVGPTGKVVEVKAGETTHVEAVFGGYKGRITGRVVAGRDIPVENVWVQAVPSDYEKDTNIFRTSDIVTEGRRSLTDLDGRFKLNGLSETGTFVIIAERPLGGQAKLTNVKPGSDIEIFMPATGSLEGQVVSADGQPVEQFTLMVVNRETGQNLSQLVRDIDGKWQVKNITPGSLEITVADSKTNIGTLTKSLSPGQELKGLLLELRPR